MLWFFTYALLTVLNLTQLRILVLVPVHRVVSRAKCAGKVTERSRNNAHMLSLWSPFYFLQKALQRLKERGPCLSDPSSDNDDFGVEGINDGCDSCSQVIH